MRAVRVQPGRKAGTLALTFSYDEELVAFVKQIPGRVWDKAYKVWAIPDSPENVRWLQVRLPANVRLVMDDAIAAQAAARAAALVRAGEARDRGDSGIDFAYVTAPYAHQRAGLEFLAHAESGALLWEMGLGKSKTAIDYGEWLFANHARADAAPLGSGVAALYPSVRVLVICPNTVKRNWLNEIAKHAGHTDYVLPTGTLKKRAEQLGTARYTVINCEALSYREMAAALQAIEWDLVIVDESTRFKSPKAARTKLLHKLSARRRVILTGTPITNTAEDAWAQYHFIAPGLLGSFWSFSDKYLAKDWFGNVTGVRPGMDVELANRLGSRSYRILKSEVVDLPPKVYQDRIVELDGAQKKAYDQMRDELRVALGARSIEAFNILTQLLRLTQITAGLVGEGDQYHWLGDQSAKVRELDHLLNEELAHEQVVVFGLYQRELIELWKRYAPPSTGLDTWDLPSIIYGPTPEHRRHELVEQFQRGDRRLLFAQIRTGGIGINLTAAKNAVYHTRGWSLEEYLQSQDRLHRIGQTGTVNIIHVTAEGTVDEHIAKALAGKQNLADVLTGDAVRALARDVLGGSMG